MLLIAFGGYMLYDDDGERWPDGCAMLLLTLGEYMLYEPTVIHFHEALPRLVDLSILGLRPVQETLAAIGRQASTRLS